MRMTIRDFQVDILLMFSANRDHWSPISKLFFETDEMISHTCLQISSWKCALVGQR